MTPAPIVTALAEQPAYYALYGLYADYMRNNAWHLEREYFERLRRTVLFVQPLRGLVQPYMKSWDLRLFTERDALDRFTPEVASAAWRLVRQVIEAVGVPRRAPRQSPPVGALRAPAHQARNTPPKPQPPSGESPFPRSPVDYRMAI